MSRWFVTGSEGFVGRNLVEALRANGEEVEGFDQTILPGELVEYLDEGAAFGADYAVHLAAISGKAACLQNLETTMLTNLNGVMGSLMSCLDHGGPKGKPSVRRYVFASSGSTAEYPLGMYGMTKRAGEMMCEAFWKEFGLETIPLRFANIYGPHSLHKNSAVHAFIRAALAGEPLKVVGGGAHQRDFVYVGDVVRAIRAACSAEYRDPRPLRVGSGKKVSVYQLAEMILDYAGGGAIKLNCPGDPGPITVDSYIYETESVIGWKPTVPLEEGLQKTIEWYRENWDANSDSGS